MPYQHNPINTIRDVNALVRCFMCSEHSECKKLIMRKSLTLSSRGCIHVCVIVYTCTQMHAQLASPSRQLQHEAVQHTSSLSPSKASNTGTAAVADGKEYNALLVLSLLTHNGVYVSQRLTRCTHSCDMCAPQHHSTSVRKSSGKLS